MRSRTALMTMALVGVLAAPTPAYAVTSGSSSTSLVPEWLSMAFGGIGLIISIVLLVDAMMLRRVAEGSIVAENIAYMMSGVVCFGAAMLARWVAIFTPAADVAEQMGWAADLLVTAGMALFAAYFMRVRRAMQRYLDAAKAAYPGADEILGSSTQEPGSDGEQSEGGDA